MLAILPRQLPRRLCFTQLIPPSPWTLSLVSITQRLSLLARVRYSMHSMPMTPPTILSWPSAAVLDMAQISHSWRSSASRRQHGVHQRRDQRAGEPHVLDAVVARLTLEVEPGLDGGRHRRGREGPGCQQG